MQTGKELWSQRWLTRYGVNAADPILAGDEVFLSSGYNKGCASPPERQKPEGNLAKQEPAKPVQFERAAGWLPVRHRRRHHHDDNARCVEWKTGQVRWSKDGIGSGPLMAADGKLVDLERTRRTAGGTGVAQGICANRTRQGARR